MFLIFIPILTSLLVGSQVRAQDDQFSSDNGVYYTPYGPSSQYNPMGSQYSPQIYNNQPQSRGLPSYGQPPMSGPPPSYAQPSYGDSLESELDHKIAGQTGVPIEPAPSGIDSQQPGNDFVAEAPCDKPGSERMPLEMMCSLPPHKGNGDDDIFRYYYNPVVQQCIPFSYSGKGGNANRFVSVKNCYELCHPADPTVKKPRVVSGIKAYLVPNLKADCKKSAKQKEQEQLMLLQRQPKEVVIRQIPHPLDPTKTLTIIQNAQYIPKDPLTKGNDPSKKNNLDPNVRRLYQYEDVPQYIMPYPYGGQQQMYRG